MRRGATLVLGLLLSAACGSRTDLWSMGGLGTATPTGKGGSAGAGTGQGGTSITGGGGNVTTGTGAGGIGGTGPGGTSGGGGTTSGTGGAAGATGGVGGGSAGTGGAPPDGGTICLLPIRAEFSPMGLYLLIDKSASMATIDPPNVPTDTRWARMEDAINLFALQTGHPFRTGLGFFPLLPSGPDHPPSCARTDYATPAMEMLPSPSYWKVSSVLAAQALGGEAPTGPAFDGALSFTLQWAVTNHPNDDLARTPPSIALITDGVPTACGSTVDGVAASAAAAYRGRPRIRTYVLAVGQDAKGLDPIAVAGGTARPIPSGVRDLDEAVGKLARSRVVCDIPLEESLIGTPAVASIEVHSRLVRSAAFAANPKVPNAESCGVGNGWFFEPPDKPTMILLCPSTCAGIIDAPAGELLAGIPCGSTPPAVVFP